MKHSQWLRLQAEGDRIVASFRADGFNCRKQPRRLSWQISKDSVAYKLTWLPAPINEWSLLPNDGTLQRERLVGKIHSILEHRGCGDFYRSRVTSYPIWVGAQGPAPSKNHLLFCRRYVTIIQY